MKKIISLLLVVILTVSIFGTTVFAFADLEESRWDWARESIEAMTKQGLIAGYSEEEFGPADGVTTLHAMLFMSRIIGFYEPSYQGVLQKANELYEEFLAPYQLKYQSEIAFLMYYNIFSKQELETYLEATKLNQVMKRYEAAVFLTKIAGAEQNLGAGALDFEDADKIPDHVKNHISYVVNKGYMVGMSETEFWADYEVNRAQMATMLYRIVKDLNITYITGEIVTASDSSVSVKTEEEVKAYQIPTTAEIRINGEIGSLETAKRGDTVLLKLYNGVLRYVDVLPFATDGQSMGYVLEKETGTPNQLTVVLNGSEEKSTYRLTEDCKIYNNSQDAAFADVLPGDTVTLSFQDGEICKIEIAERVEKVSSVKFVGLVQEPQDGIQVKNAEGVQRIYFIDEDVTVRRNVKSVELKDLLPGDDLTLTLNSKNQVTTIKASSTKSTISGIVEEIHISSAESSVTIKMGTESENYLLSTEAEITIDGKAGDVYSLRLGYMVDLTLESDVAVKMDIKAVQANNTLIGTVDEVSSKYGYLYVLVTENGKQEKIQVFTLKDDATMIIDNKNNNEPRALKKIEQGESVMISGTKQADGTFSAATIVILVK